MVWLHRSHGNMEMGVLCGLKIGSKKRTIFQKNYDRNELKDIHVTPIKHDWRIGIVSVSASQMLLNYLLHTVFGEAS